MSITVVVLGKNAFDGSGQFDHVADDAGINTEALQLASISMDM